MDYIMIERYKRTVDQLKALDLLMKDGEMYASGARITVGFPGEKDPVVVMELGIPSDVPDVLSALRVGLSKSVDFQRQNIRDLAARLNQFVETEEVKAKA